MSTDGNLRALFKNNVSGHWQAIEVGAVGSGVPDSNFCLPPLLGEERGTEGWVEFKQTSAWSVGLRPEQVAWISRRCRVGGCVFVAVRRRHDGGPRLGAPVDELYIFSGSLVRELQAEGLRCTPPLWVGVGGPREWNWDEVARILSQ